MDLLTDTDLDVVTHTVAAIGRTGAASFEFGFLDDEPPHRWWASARYDGTKVTCDNQDTPAGAVLGLYAMLAAGGGCTICRRTVALDEGGRIVIGARMRRGRFETRAATGNPDTYCIRRLDVGGWTGCSRSDHRGRCAACGHQTAEHGPSGCAADDEAAMGGCDCLEVTGRARDT